MKKNMKKYFKMVVLASIAVLAVSCTDTVKSLTGSYSYQIAKKGVSINDSIPAKLTSEIGALEIERSKDDKVLLTFNSMKGDVYTTKGKIDDKTITLEPFSRTLDGSDIIKQEDVLPPTVEKTVNETFNVDVSGEAEIHDETIHFFLQYAGTGISDNSTTITGENILMIAKKN